MPLRASVTSIPTTTGEEPQTGDPAFVLIDGSDTPISAAGLSDYRPTPGDRLLVERVGTQVEVIQYLSRGTVPYISELDISDLRSEVDLNTADIDSANNEVSVTQNDLANYQVSNDETVALLLPILDTVLSAGTEGIDIDYFWVGDAPQSVVQVPISQFVQDAVGAPTYQQFTDAINVWDKDQIGDIQYTGTVDPPMTTFYDRFVATGVPAQPWNA